MNPKALHKISYGLYVVCSKKGEKINGQTANAVIQVTSEPPTIAIGINKQNLTHEYIKESKTFAVSILSQDTPLSFIGQFGFKSGRDIDKFSNVNHKAGKAQTPVVLDHTLAYLEAKVIQELDVGTHTIFVGEVVEAEVLKEVEPMTYAYYQKVKRGTTPKTAPTYIKEEKRPVPSVKYRCKVCGYIYDPEKGDYDGRIIFPGTPFEDVPPNWVCSVCGVGRGEFEAL